MRLRLTTTAESLRAAVVMLLVAGAALAPSASAVTTAGTARPLISGPRFAGDPVAWGARDRDTRLPSQPYGFLVRLAANGHVRTLGHVAPQTPQFISQDPDLAASADLVAASSIQTYTQTPSAGTRPPADTYTWPVGPGASAHFGSCGATLSSSALLGLVSVQGTEVVSCGEDRQSVLIYDGPSGAVLAQLPARDPVAFRLAGSFVAWLERGDGNTFTLVAYDRERSAEVMRLPTQALGEQFRWWDLQSDGTIAYAVEGPDSRQRVGWTSVADPTPHAVPLTPSSRDDGYVVKIVGGTIAFRRGNGAKGVIGVTPLNGPARILARGVSNGFDFDGRQLAFSYRSCEADVIARMNVGGPAFRAPVPRTCPLRLTSRGIRISRDGRHASVRLRCDLNISGCSGPARLYAMRGSRRGLRIGQGSSDSALGSLRLSTSAASKLRRGAAIRARLTVRLDNDPEHPSGRSRTVLLRVR